MEPFCGPLFSFSSLNCGHFMLALYLLAVVQYINNMQTKQLSGSNAYWSLSQGDLYTELGSGQIGLSDKQVAERLRTYGPNLLKPPRKNAPIILFINQFISPLLLILVFAAIISMVTGEWIDAMVVFLIIFASAVFGFLQEYNSGNAIEKLRKKIRLRANVIRNGVKSSVLAEEVVPGDILVLAAGSIIAADAVILESDGFFVNQAALTGETFPVEKKPDEVPANASLQQRTNCVFMGTDVRSGSATAIVFCTGGNTEYGHIADELAYKAPETEFERGIRTFGNMLTQVMTLLVLVVFAINVILSKPPVDSLLFSVALAVGMAPELLPAIISITLSRGARKMAREGVIVRRLEAIENFGSMDVLCTDKTGTLTIGVVNLDGAIGYDGKENCRVGILATLNAKFQSGLPNPLDEAILGKKIPTPTDYSKTEEVPYDFTRKRLSIVVSQPGMGVDEQLMITKGALEKVLEASAYVDNAGKIEALTTDKISDIETRFQAWSEDRYRVLGIAT